MNAMRHDRFFLTILFCCISLILASCQNEVADPSLTSSSAGNASGLNKVIQRDITDFLSTQVNVTGWSGAAPDYPLFFVADYAGVINNTYGLGLPSTFEGTITDRALSDGTAEVRIMLRAHNVLTYVIDNNFPFPTFFGARRSEVQNGATPTLGDADLDITLINSAPNAPIPDLFSMETTPRITFHASAFGPLRAAAGFGPDGTPGHAWTNQIGLLTKVHGHPSINGFATENVRLQAVGH
jgi:hypothetical protein